MFTEITVKLSLMLHPSRLDNGKSQAVNAAVREDLNSFLLSYIDEAGGFLLSVRDIEILDSGYIHNDKPYVTFPVKVRMLVFRPMAGEYQVGEVVEVATDHIGLLLLGTFNVTVSKAALSNNYTFDGKSHSFKWKDKGKDADKSKSASKPKAKADKADAKTDGSRDITKGSFVRFRVTGLQLSESDDEFPSILGALNEADTGALTGLTHLQLQPPPSIAELHERLGPAPNPLKLLESAEASNSSAADDAMDDADSDAASDAAAAGSSSDASDEKSAKRKKDTPTKANGKTDDAKSGQKMTAGQKKQAKRDKKAAEKDERRKRKLAILQAGSESTPSSSSSSSSSQSNGVNSTTKSKTASSGSDKSPAEPPAKKRKASHTPSSSSA